MSLLLQECSKQGLLSEANMNNLIDKRYQTPESGKPPEMGLEHLVLGEQEGAAVLTLGDCSWHMAA